MTGEKKPESTSGGNFDDLFNTDTGGGEKKPPEEEAGAAAEGAGDLDMDLSLEGLMDDDSGGEFTADAFEEAPEDAEVQEAQVEQPPADEATSILQQRIAVVRKVLEGKGFLPEKIEAAVQMIQRNPPPAEFTQAEGTFDPDPEPQPDDQPVGAPAEETPGGETAVGGEGGFDNLFDTGGGEGAGEAAPEEPKKKMKKIDPELLAQLEAEQAAEAAAAAGADAGGAAGGGYTQTACYNCGAMVDIPPERPATVTCPNCGTQGVIN